MNDEVQDMTEAQLEELGPEPYTGGPLPPPFEHRAKRKKGSMPERSEETLLAAASSQAKDIEEYLAQYDWEMPEMRCKLTRLAPQLWKGMQVGGHLESKMGPYTLDEIGARFGGGQFEIFVSGPKVLGEPARSLGRKRFTVAGEARVDALPTHVSSVMSGRQQNPDNELAPQAQAGLVGLVGKSFDSALRAATGGSGGGGGVDHELLSQVSASVERAADAQVKAIKEAAAQENNVLRSQLDELRRTTTELRAEVKIREEQAERNVDHIRVESSSLLGTLLPTMTEHSHNRAEAAVKDAGERVARIQEQYARDLQAAEQRFSMQGENLRTLYEAQMINSKTIYDGRVAQLDGEIHLLRLRNEHLEAEVKSLRDKILEQFMQHQQKQDIGTQMQHFAALRDMAEGVFSSGKGGDDGGLSEDAPDYMRMINSFAPTLNAVAGAVAQKFAAPQPVQPAQAPVQPQPQPQPQPGQQMVPYQAPQQPQARPQPKRKRAPDAVIKKSDLEMGAALLSQAISNNTSPENAANAAANAIDRQVLWALARRPAQRIWEALVSNHIVTDGPLTTPEGQAYLEAFLQALKVRLSGQSGQAPAPAAAPEPEDEQE